LEQVLTIEVLGQAFTFKTDVDISDAKTVADYLVQSVNEATTPAVRVIGMMCFDPTLFLKGAESGFGVQVLHVQKSLKKPRSTHLPFWIKGRPTRHFGGGTSRLQDGARL
jgi:hypothetical protein